MSSSIAAVSSGSNSLLPSSSSSANAAQFREIHKNTWLKRLTADGKRITVGPKKSERSWVVFCVHDDTEALLEGYAEPRQAACHSPEWIVSMQDTLHISHALIPNSHEFEFVVTLSNEVVRFHAMSWEIMQEWVETLRSKLREMKILSPRENLYTKLPEMRAPLLPTRDPTSPLPAPPPVPAALVPGVERVVPQNTFQEYISRVVESVETTTPTLSNILEMPSTTETIAASTQQHLALSNTINVNVASTSANTTTASSGCHTANTTAPILSAMSNMLTQNLLNMLSDPISAYNEQLNDEAAAAAANRTDAAMTDNDSCFEIEVELSDLNDEFFSPLLRRTSLNPCKLHTSVSESASNLEKSLHVDIGASNRSSADQIQNLENLLQCERLIPRPQTSRSLSAGAADNSKKQKTTKSQSKEVETATTTTSSKQSNVTALEMNPAATNQSYESRAATTTASTTAANITIIQVSTNSNSVKNAGDATPPKLPSKTITAEIFKFPETMSIAKLKQHEYKSNVQIIPSNLNSSTIQVLGPNNVAIPASNQYTTPVKKVVPAQEANGTVPIVSTATTVEHCETQKVTTVHVRGDSGTNVSASVYGTCYTIAAATAPVSSAQSTPKLPKKIILSANTSGITSITVNNSIDTLHENEEEREDTAIRKKRNTSASTTTTTSAIGDISVNVHYDKIFLSSSIPITAVTTIANSASSSVVHPPSPKLAAQRKSPRRCTTGLPVSVQPATSHSTLDALPLPLTASDTKIQKAESVSQSPQMSATNRNKAMPSSNSHAISALSTTVGGSPVLQRRRIGSSTNLQRIPVCSVGETGQLQVPTLPPFLRRGLTEAVITTRPSRKDFHLLRLSPNKSSKLHNITTSKSIAAVPAASTSSKTTAATCNNNDETASTSTSNGGVAGPLVPLHAAVYRTHSESLEQRRRSSSTSDAQVAQRNTRGANNNEFPGSRAGSNGALRIQQPPQPFRSVENGIGNCMGGVSAPTTTTNSPAAKRITLREQQVMQLRREIMHPGGVRLQLRRKDCVGSIAWVDAFGAVWVAGWKQREHPVLYNALHIGDQLISIAGVAVSTAAEANKAIRNANTLFVEVLMRRLPFGRGYAIRREREFQCLGLIRDGNTATIVDVVPNSLAARHGLPPKAQSCDGSTLTFWVLTEINGRPLNLFLKEHEIRDRLHSVGRDISILVQPSDLVTKLKKQLKSLRGYKDYLVQ